MINTSEHKNEDIVKSGITEYSIGFPFYFNPDRTPQLLVKIGDEKLRFNHNFELSEDKGSVILRPTEEESWTLKDPEDFSWMTKWDGKDLLIERAVPFVQDSDYQLGRISSEQIERDFDLSVMRDQILQQQITDNDADLESLFDTVAEHRKDIDRAQKSADDAMAHSVAVEKRVSVNEKGIAANKEAAARAQKSADDAMAHSVALEKRVAVNETGIATNKSAAARAQKSADDAMAHSVAVEKRVTQTEKDIKSNDADISTLFTQQVIQDETLSGLEFGKLDKNQGKVNIGKILTVGGDGMIVPKASQGSSGISVVAHDNTLIGAGTDEYPLGVKDKVTITIEDWE
jgi:hypothetical protein